MKPEAGQGTKNRWSYLKSVRVCTCPRSIENHEYMPVCKVTNISTDTPDTQA